MKQLRSYQIKAVELFTDVIFFCLNFACGLGKTLTAAVIAEKKQLPTIIIAPNSLCDQWRDELIELGVDADDIFVASAPEENKDPERYEAKLLEWLNRGK